MLSYTNPLFQDMTTQEIDNCLRCAKAVQKNYRKNEVIFSQDDPPSALYVLCKGSVAVCKDSADGKRYIVTTIEEHDVFGEVFLFLNNIEYSYYVVATQDSQVLEIPKSYFDHSCTKQCNHHPKIVSNLLSILAHKAYFLNQKVQLLASGSLRQKLIRYLLGLPRKTANENIVLLSMNREELADYLNVARPSLSRELMKLVKEGLISVANQEVKLHQIETLNSYL